ncbi:MAG TPA: lysylphosphatidylglycerol synthase domain-containing protein, partial [Salinarimonas sp.]|nr:lysylphosphatidylglycerol synthase domain-containing protein [Salinarimonas sp.]
WGLECLGVYLCAVGLGADAGFLMVTFVFAVSSLLGVLSMIPGGIGAVEAGLALLLAPGTDHDLVVLCAGAADRNPHLRSLLRAAHEALLVVRSGETSFASLEDLRAWLGALAGRIGGAVLICDHAPAPRDGRARTAYGPAALAREAAP